MWPFKKKEKSTAKTNPIFAEIEAKYPLGKEFIYLGESVFVVGHHEYQSYVGKYTIRSWYNPGVRVEWWSTLKELKQGFVRLSELQFLIPKIDVV
jgi:hypothetical protein